MARSIRVLYSGRSGVSRHNVSWGPITADSAVVVSAAEWSPAGGIFPATFGRSNLGAANVYVTNIGPHNPEGGAGGVEFLLHVDWPQPLWVMVTVTVLENVESFFVG